MTPGFTKTLVEGFPLIYSPNFYFECDSGWYNLLYDLSADLNDYIKVKSQENIEYTQFAVQQVKEKFGGLRYYVSFEDEHIGGSILTAENRAYKTCEKCGSTEDVKLTDYRIRGWIKSYCLPCTVEWYELRRGNNPVNP